MNRLLIAALLAGSFGLAGVTGCDKTIEEKKTVEQKRDGTTVEKSSSTTEKPDGTVVEKKTENVDKK